MILLKAPETVIESAPKTDILQLTEVSISNNLGRNRPGVAYTWEMEGLVVVVAVPSPKSQVKLLLLLLAVPVKLMEEGMHFAAGL